MADFEIKNGVAIIPEGVTVSTSSTYFAAKTIKTMDLLHE